MTQLSRPYQIALVTLALFALVWFVALHRTSSSGGGSGASPSATSAPAAPSAAGEAKAAAAPTKIYHGSAPGVEGLTRAINKAHGAVAQSQREARRVETSEPSSSSSSSSSAAAAAATTTTDHVAAGAGTHPVTLAPAKPAHHATPPAVKRAATAPNMQAVVEQELQQGKTVLILFWNRHSSVDAAVHNALASVQHTLGGRVAVHYASAGQVGAFGTVTHAVPVAQTPTLLIVNHHGQTSVLTGLNDAFAIQQAIAEAHHS